MLDICKVLKVHPESNSVDLEMMDDGRKLAGVPVLVGAAASDCGTVDLPDPESKTGNRDVYCVVGRIKAMPIVIGFIHPQVSQCCFLDKDRLVYRHASDVYVTIDADGNTEVRHPSGTYFRIATEFPHEDLTGKDYDKKWAITRNTGKAVYAHLEVKKGNAHKASLTLTPDGHIHGHATGDISLKADGDVSVRADKNIMLKAMGEVSVEAMKDVQVKAMKDVRVHAMNELQLVSLKRMTLWSMADNIVLMSRSGRRVI